MFSPNGSSAVHKFHKGFIFGQISQTEMLKDLHIQNYRLFEDFKMEGLGKVNLIAGKNNTGKTALLEALRIIESKGSRTVLSNIILERGELKPNNSESYSTLFTRSLISEKGDQPRLEIQFGKSILLYREITDGNYPDYFITLTRSNGNPIINKLSSPSSGETPYDEAIYIPFSNGDLSISDLWINVTLTPKKKVLIKILKCVEPRIVDIDIPKQDAAMVLLADDEIPVPLKNLGDGANRLLVLALSLINAKNKLLLIDEFESGLHYSVQEQLWEIVFEYAKKWDIQVFATTHSLDAVKSFFYVLEKKTYDGMGKFFRLQKSRKGPIEAITYDENKLEFALEHQLDPR